MDGEAGSPVTVVSFRPRTAAGGGRPQAGLEFVEKVLPTNLTSMDTTVRNAGMLRVLRRRVAGRSGYWLHIFLALVIVVAVATGGSARARRP